MNAKTIRTVALLGLMTGGLAGCGSGFTVATNLASKSGVPELPSEGTVPVPYNPPVVPSQPDVPTVPSGPIPEKTCSTTSFKSGGARRMNAREYINSIKSLIGDYAIDKSELPPDSKNLRDFDTDGASLHILELDADKYYAVTDRITEAAFATGKAPTFVTCSLDTTQGGVTAQACFDQSLRKLLLRAFRKEVTSALITRFTSLVANETTPRLKMKLATQAALMSQDFLFLNANVSQAAGLTNLNSYQVAERLSFFLWSSVPDDTLMAAAAQSQLMTDAGLKSQVTRMMQDARFANFYEGFFNQWLKLDNLPAHSRDKSLFPEYTPELLTSMGLETRTFLQNIVTQNRPLDEILNADYSYVDQRLAQYYGIAGVTGTQFQKVALPSLQRRGILTQGSILTVTGRNASATAPVRRGVYVLKKLTCTPPPPPPPDIPSFPEDPVSGAELTAKQKLAAHRVNPSCQSCHSLMDPIGIGLENFDNFGKWRTKYSATLDVDSEESLFNIPFNTPPGLVLAINEAKAFKSCLADTLTVYALSKTTTNDDKCHAENLVTRVMNSGGSFADLITELVKSEMFQKEIGD